jgi:hypothetical protein
MGHINGAIEAIIILNFGAIPKKGKDATKITGIAQHSIIIII